MCIKNSLVFLMNLFFLQKVTVSKRGSTSDPDEVLLIICLEKE